MTRRKLDQLDIEYSAIELSEESARDFIEDGLRAAPVIEVDMGFGALWRWSGYSPSQIERLDHALSCDIEDCTTCYTVIAA
jgi:hypothetical protein